MKARHALLAIALAVGLLLTLLWILIVQASTNQWTPTGPPGGPYYTDFQPDYYRAEILAVAVDPNTPGTVYALAASPNVQGPTKIYKSTDRGENWTVCYTATNQLDALAVSGTLVYAGGPYKGSCCEGPNYIFKSSDGGLHWTEIYTSPGKDKIMALAIHPLTPTTVYAAGWGPGTEGTVKRTTNGGLNWTDLLTVTSNGFEALVIHPLTPTIVYAGGDDGIYRSTDGLSFNKVYTDGGVYDLAINPFTPTTVYAGTEGAQNAVLRSTDGGLNWTEVLTDPLQSRPFLAVDPPNTVYAIDKYESTVYSSTVDGDPGTWNQTASPNGWYANDLTIEPPSYLYAAMGGQENAGVYRSDDGGDSWSMKNDGLRVPIGLVDIAIDPQDPSILYTTGFEPGGWKSTDSGVTWSFMSGTSYLWCFAIHPLTPTTVLAGGSCNQCPTIYRSTNGGLQWTGVYTSPGVATSYGHVRALAIHPVTPSIAYAVEWNDNPLNNGRILRSTDGGLSWTAVYTENGLELETVAAGSALAGGQDANGNGVIYHSSDGMTNWTRVHTTSRGIRSIVVHPVTRTIVLASQGNYIHKSTDGGLTWPQSTKVWGPKLTFNPLDANIVYCVKGCDPKISTDGGDTWDLLRAGMPAGGWVGAIAVDRAAGIQTIYIGYAGVWSYSQPSPLQIIYLPIIMKNS